MKYIYILFGGFYYEDLGNDTIGVFSTLEKAIEYQKIESVRYDFFCIEEHILDSTTPKTENVWVLHPKHTEPKGWKKL